MKPTVPHLAILAACAFFTLGAPLHAALLLEYNFNADSLTQPSSGSIGDSVTISGAGEIGADQSGVSGLAGDRAFNNTGNNGMGNGAGSPNNGSAAGPVDLPALTSLTITGWFNASSTISGFAQLFNSNQLTLLNQADAPGTLMLSINGTNSNRSTTVGTNYYSLSNTWVFFAATWDGTTLKFYQGLTGTSVTQLGTDIAFSPTMSDPAAGIAIGNSATANRPFDGLMDNVRLYDNVLTSAQLEDLRVLDVTTVPEPSSAVLALAGLAFLGRRRTGMRGTLLA